METTPTPPRSVLSGAFQSFVSQARFYLPLALILVIMCFLTVLQGLQAQSSTCVPPAMNGNGSPWSEECYLNNNCGVQGNPCQAGDITLLNVYLANAMGNPLPPCTLGQSQNALLWGTFQNHTGTSRYAVRSRTEVWLNGVFTIELNSCSFDVMASGQTAAALLGTIPYTCGNQIQLKNTWIAWNTSSSQCSNSMGGNYAGVCGDYSPSKCFKDFGFISFLSPNFSYTCMGHTPTTTTICFTDLTVGGTPPYTYSWNFGDSGTSTAQNPCHTYTGLSGNFTVSLTVTDAVPNSASVSTTINLANAGCCSLTVNCPPANGGFFQCLNQVPAPNPALAVVIDSCGPVTRSIVQTSVGTGCGMDTLIITRKYILTDGITHDTCTQKFKVLDTTPPVLTCAADITIQCNESTAPAHTGNATATDQCGPSSVSHADYFGVPGVSPDMRWVYFPPGATSGTCSSGSNCQSGTICFGLQYTPAHTGNLTSYTTGFFVDCYNGNNPIITNHSCVMNDMSAQDPDCGGTGLILMNSSGNSGLLPITQNVPVILHQVCFQLGAGANILLDEDEATDLSTSIDLPGGGTTSELPSFTNEHIKFDSICSPSLCQYPSSIYREFVATDQCGNASTCIQHITVKDTSPPVVSCPADVTLNCTANTLPVATGTATSTDNCDLNPTISFADQTIAGSCPQNYFINRTWSATDVCGNTGSCIQHITVRDNTPPAINCPTNITVQCANLVPIPNPALVTSSDICGGVTNSFVADVTVSQTCINRYTLIRTYRATDACGNSSTCNQLITVFDNVPPGITCPANLTVQCANQVPAPNTSLVTATDFCGTPPVVSFVSDVTTSQTCVNRYTLTRTYRATDACGNSMTCNQIITVNDQTAPALTCPAPVTVSCIGQVPAVNVGTVSTTDNCSGTVVVTFVGDVISGTTCNNRLTVTRTYRATDACGNSATCNQIITVNDQTSPTITCPAPITVTCANLVPNPDPTTVTRSDNCGGTPTVTFISDVTTNQTCTNRYTITRTYRATDLCGNSSTCTQLITVFDQTAPSIVCPPAVTVSCANLVPAPNPASATASDNCGGAPVVTFISDVTTGQTCINRYTITRTYQAMDACGNTATCTQTITVNDQTPPTITCPPSVTVNCANLLPSVDVNSVIAGDNCSGGVTVTFVGDVTSNQTCANQFTVTRTYRATDACGNSATCNQVITILDNSLPAITCPANLTVQCASLVPVPNPATVTTSDNCGGIPTISFLNDVTTGQTCVNRYNITRTYRAVDACGNSATCTQVITVFDNTIPTITCPANVSVQCASQVPIPTPGSITANDNCGGTPTVTFVSDITTNQSCVNRYNISRTYRATDACGNSATCVQTIFIFDNTNPTLTCPADLTFQCANQVPAPNPAAITSSDNCSSVPVVTFVSDVTAGQTCLNRYTLNRTYRSTDECGNSATCVQVITVFDNTPPTITCPINITLQCANLVPAPNPASVITSDNCSGIPVVTFVGDITTGQTCINRYTLNRTYRSTDECGNSATCVQVITVFDNTPPSITCPANLTVQCANLVPLPSIALISSSDNCNGIPVVTFVSDVTVGQICVNRYTLNRTYRSTDECGNSATCVQVISVFDNTPPQIICPPNMTVECATSIPAVNTSLITTSENCKGPVTVTHLGDFITNQVCANRYTMTRVYMATDDCGNSATCSQVFTVDDETAPALQCPANTTVECADQVPPVNALAVTTTDNCVGPVSVVHVGDQISNQTCANRYTLTRTYRAMDDCGNSATCTQVITVFDHTPPVINCPDDITVGVEESTSPDHTGTATASDNCEGTPQITSSDVTTGGVCPLEYKIHRTWTAVDACGQSSTCLQEVVVSGGCFVDLSLSKSLAMGQPMQIHPGDNIAFTITVTNNGNIPIGSVSVIDYIPVGFALNDLNWTPGTDGSTGQSASIVLSIGNGYLPAGGLQPAASVQINIVLKSSPSLAGGSYTNVAEIASVLSVAGVDISDQDVDSTPDNNDTNDPPGEDDHDPLVFCVIIDPIIIGDPIVCSGDTSTYHVAQFNPEHAYNWVVGSGGVIIHNVDSAITVLWYDPPGSVITITLTETAGQECQFFGEFNVTIGRADAIACIDHINLSIGNDCGTQITSGMILTGDQAGDNSYQVFVIDMTTGDTIPNATVDWTNVGKTYKVSIRSKCTGQSCWGLVTIEDKTPPIINCICPASNGESRCRISCLAVDLIINGHTPEQYKPTIVDDCGGGTLIITNIELHYESCTEGTATITWLATDHFGNKATCVQEYDVIPLNLEGLVFPKDVLGDCDDPSDPDHTGWPYLGGLPLSPVVQSCNIWTSYTDQVIALCGQGRKIIRRWKVINWCNSQTVTYNQIIILKDRVGPVLTCDSDITVSTDVWNCSATVNMHKPAATDACSSVMSYQLFVTGGTVTQNGDNYRITDLGIGVHYATWTVTDACYNTTSCVVQITVQDKTPPVVSCQQRTVVSLTDDRPGGVTLVPAEAFDDHSFDNCSPVTLLVRRMTSCIDFNWTTKGACVDDTPGGSPPVDGFDTGTEWGSCIPVSCCDLGQDPFMVMLQVTDASGNSNTCMVLVEVQDKLAPEVICPPTIAVSCKYLFDIQEGTFSDAAGNNDGSLDEDPLSAVFGNVYDAFHHQMNDRKHVIINDPDNPNYPQPHDWGLDGWATDNCRADISVNVSVIDDCSGASFPGDYPAGAVKLILRRFIVNDGTRSQSCLQKIWVIDYNRFFISDQTCHNDNPNDGVIWPCDTLITNCPEEISGTGEPIIFDDGCSLIGMTFEDERFDFVDDACYKILRTWKIIDWCQFNVNTGYGIWTYVQTIKVADHHGPDFISCPAEPLSLCTNDPGISLPANNQLFLGVNNPNATSCSVHVIMHQPVVEMCSGTVIYDVKIYPFNGPDFIQIKPETTVPVDTNHVADLYFDTQESTIPQIHNNGLPYNDPLCDNYHRVVWSVEDGCGNRSYCDFLFRLVDCKKPTPVCIDGLSTAVMQQNGQVTVYAADFNASSVDDCTPTGDLLFSFSGDTYEPSFTYTCDNVPAFGVPFDVSVWTADGGSDLDCDGVIEWNERNKDFCIASLVITDNFNACDNEGGILVGDVLTEQTEAVSQVMVHLSGPTSEFPPMVTANDGRYTFGNVPFGLDYTLRADRNDDPRNGVSTLDLVQIQKHLLGKELFSSAYQYIAADANNSGTVSAIDLIEIRKVILGLSNEFPNNKSWRFVKAADAANPGPPWPITETLAVHNLQSHQNYDLNFVGVKIGDVNHSAVAHAGQILPRSSGRILDLEAVTNGDIQSGQMVDCKIIFPETVNGFQWTLETDGLDYAGISSHDIPIDESYVGLLGQGVITMSWNGDRAQPEDAGKEMSILIHFTAKQSGKLKDMLRMTSLVTPAEAYTINGETVTPQLIFDAKRPFTEFALYQNKPNPWDGQTLIEFDLPHDAHAKLTVYDIAGKVVKVLQGDYRAGHNSMMLTSHDIPTPGVLYYRLDSGEFSAVKKMMIFH